MSLDAVKFDLPLGQAFALLCVASKRGMYVADEVDRMTMERVANG